MGVAMGRGEDGEILGTYEININYVALYRYSLACFIVVVGN